ncbi:hypothetical protein CKO28_22185 [Rhodovibrio sodomensis]|uniref:Uncharacterized protein n=1 Tax=Rhodovibrio sodomensis TaxID=1088 RepID=A0ABS1DLW9_9PROT|nr:hypothetical protein [Rhodovibrio sodomensis]
MQRIARPFTFLGFRDVDGVRHVVRVSSVQTLSDADLDRQETLLVAANRMYRVSQPIDTILDKIGGDLRVVDGHGDFG